MNSKTFRKLAALEDKYGIAVGGLAARQRLKVLVLDIETSPLLAYVWDRHDQNIGLNQIKDEWYVIAWAAKWLGDLPSKVMYEDQRNKDISNDYYLLCRIWKLLDEADIIITQNGQNFDARKLNARFIHWGMRPPSPYRHIDTYRIAKRVAKFTANSLEYLAGKLCRKYKKLTHSKFPGMALWTECLKGNIKAWNEMKRYNIHDVLATEELYMKLRAWAPDTTATPWFVPDAMKCCRTCGKDSLLSNGQRYTKTACYKRLRCSKCGSSQIGAKIILGDRK